MEKILEIKKNIFKIASIEAVDGKIIINFEQKYIPKNGEYFYVKSKSGFSYIAIAKNGEYLTSRFASFNQDYGRLKYNELGFVCTELNIKEIRPATKEERELLDKALEARGKKWNPETKQIEELKDLEEPNLLGEDGKYFTAKIGDNETKGRIRVKDNDVYLCQDEVDGCNCQDKFGYKYSYFIRKGTEDDLKGEDVTNLKLWDYLPKEGEYFYVKPQSTREYIAIAKEGKDITNSYVNLSLNSKNLYWNRVVCNDNYIKEIRPATPQEITFLDAKLKEKGKFFGEKSMSIKNLIEEPNKPTFKRGDWVLIKKPKDVGQKPYWVSSMDKYDGQTLEIEEINSDGYLVIYRWDFHPNWCTKVETLKLKVDDLCIFWNYEKTDAVIGKLTGINKSDIPYEVGSMWSYVHCIKFESMEQYNEFIKG